ncbi:MAG: endonuclease domain-containing protein [Deltaproteobacteria bacterium]|nr:endonuclease domain-containing protein [Deltaproteobacteria bacterium]MBI3388260.1 endonuclease domain-containing protein [Deltaproteobacteria bacterium]
MARKLRSDQTDAEQKLWQKIRAGQVNGAKFRRQHPVGPYFADFCCDERRLVIELDGSQHAMNVARDDARTAYLEAQSYRVLRFWDNEVLNNMESVLARICDALRSPHPSPLPGGEGAGEGPAKL